MFIFLRRKRQPPLPDWRSDWLYRLVFQKVESSWKLCQRAKDAKHWQYVLVEEWSSADGTHCDGELLRLWVRDAKGLRQIPIWFRSKHQRKIRERIFPFIIVSFHIYLDKTHIVFCHQEADTAGGGERYIVTGEANNAKLVADPSAGFWIS